MPATPKRSQLGNRTRVYERGLPLIAVLLGTLVTVVGYSSPPPVAEIGRAPFEKTMKSLLVDGDVGTNKEFERFNCKHCAWQAPPCPAQLRSLLVSWEGCSANSFYISYRLHRGEVSLSWHLCFAVQEAEADARNLLTKKLTAAGFEETKGQFKTSYLSMQHASHSADSTKSFYRSIGDTSEELFVGGIEKSRNQDVSHTTMTDVDWTLARKYEGPPPTLDELLADCPLLNSKALAPADSRRCMIKQFTISNRAKDGLGLSRARRGRDSRPY